MELKDLEAKLRELLEGKYSSLSIELNQDHLGYRTIGELEEIDPTKDWISEEERAKGIAEDSKWTMRWFPNTPGASHCYAASSLETLLNWVFENHGR